MILLHKTPKVAEVLVMVGAYMNVQRDCIEVEEHDIPPAILLKLQRYIIDQNEEYEYKRPMLTEDFKNVLKHIGLQILTLEEYKKRHFKKSNNRKPRSKSLPVVKSKPTVDPEVVRKAIEVLSNRAVDKDVPRKERRPIEIPEKVPVQDKRPPAVYSNPNWQTKYNDL